MTPLIPGHKIRHPPGTHRRRALNYLGEVSAEQPELLTSAMVVIPHGAGKESLYKMRLQRGSTSPVTSDHGGKREAMLHSLVETCTLNGMTPEAYLRHILAVFPECSSNWAEKLLPWNVELTSKYPSIQRSLIAYTGLI